MESPTVTELLFLLLKSFDCHHMIHDKMNLEDRLQVQTKIYLFQELSGVILYKYEWSINKPYSLDLNRDLFAITSKEFLDRNRNYQFIDRYAEVINIIKALDKLDLYALIAYFYNKNYNEEQTVTLISDRFSAEDIKKVYHNYKSIKENLIIT